MKPVPTPPEALSAPVRPSGGETEERCHGAANGPQAATQDVDPRAAVLDAIADVIRTGRYWLPAAGQQAIADAVMALREQPTA